MTTFYTYPDSTPSLEVAQKLANALSVSLNEMIAQNYEFEQDKELSQLFEQATQLGDFDKRVVKELLSAFLLKKDIQSKLEDDL
ncbi:MAG: hypothetical protein ACRBFS_26995 [Aureispira sp.]